MHHPSYYDKDILMNNYRDYISLVMDLPIDKTEINEYIDEFLAKSALSRHYIRGKEIVSLNVNMHDPVNDKVFIPDSSCLIKFMHNNKMKFEKWCHGGVTIENPYHEIEANSVDSEIEIVDAGNHITFADFGLNLMLLIICYSDFDVDGDVKVQDITLKRIYGRMVYLVTVLETTDETQ